MKLGFCLVLIASLGLVFASFAQDRPSDQNAAEAAAGLRAQLVEVQAKEAELNSRMSRLEEDLKPENIERSLAGVGSTKPEELREQRKRQLTIERDGLRKQLDLLAASRSRLESAIVAADARAYQQSAQQPSLTQTLVYSFRRPRVLVGVATLIGILALIGVIAFLRRS